MHNFVMMIILVSLTPELYANQASHIPILPPALPWQGQSQNLKLGPDHPWITPSEKTDFMESPPYDETIAWLSRLSQASPQVKMVSLGKSPQGRDVWMAVASKEGAASAKALQQNGRPILLAQGGIHAGEIDGKDAGMMLLRDMTINKSKTELLDQANFLFIPIVSVDGHERSSPYGRVNQRGPKEIGWRTNAQNLNLNRDYSKLDSPELQACIKAINDWQPDLYIDVHVTDGVDYQYDITWGYNGPHAYSPAIASWLDQFLAPALEQDLKAQGHIPGPLIFANDNQDIMKGIGAWTASPRYSNGYGDARHLPTILVENHSLKSYEQRVLGTYVLFESCLRTLGQHHLTLAKAILEDRSRRFDELPLTWKSDGQSPETISFLGVSSEQVHSPITGRSQIVWTGQPVTLDIPIHSSTQPDQTTKRPRAYWIPATWTDVIQRLKWHGVQYKRYTQAQTLEVEQIRFNAPKFSSPPYEGRTRVTATHTTKSVQQTFAPGSIRVSTDQPLGHLAMLLLEPDSPDSFFQWGFFNAIFQRVEYIEAYVMEPMAQAMLAEDPNLKIAFEQKLKEDEEFAKNPRARLMWFYDKTPFFDDQWRVYPIAREL